jgi:hypothetical protein
MYKWTKRNAKILNCFFVFWWEWGVNSRLHTCKEGTLLLNITSNPFFLIICGMGSCKLFAWAGLKL